MQFLASWSELSAFDLLRLLAPPGFLIAALLLPGVRVARVAALGVALAIPLLHELGTSPPLTAAWSALWLLVAWAAGAREGAARRPLAHPRGRVEAGTVGMLLGLALLALLVVAVARQDLSPEDARRASLGALILSLGLIHLMMRGHARRAGVSFASLGLGLQVLDGAARAAQVPQTLPQGGAVLIATAIAVALAMRVAASRERLAGTAWVSDAHDLHD
ncbi:MAG: hypothetical protein E6K81_03640 [Candidatus Eisenbacteria bacterium]|uniref:Uncharacterized protein n=1 Tax=Eiseniibacteriota bacterium TaxID=2212470 RepID=A0A538UCN9_UNCEI|nr:MAG: hypothetical protein E6K81_03640 [Candidatus Eisenbacteria bacterium]